MKIISIIVFLITVNIVSVFSQSGDIAGTIIDMETEKPLPGVNVIVERTDLGAATDTFGHYFIRDIPVGTYNILFRMMGYEPLKKLNIPVSPDRQTILNVALKQTDIKLKKVVVQAEVFTKAKDAVISDKNIDFTELLRDPGSAMDVQRMMQALPSVVSGSDQRNEIIVRGGYPGENLFLLDNIEIPNPNHFGQQGTGGGPISLINPLFINSVDFYAGAFPARYGGKCSSVMDIKLKEGNREQFGADVDMSMAGLGLFVEGPISNGKASYMLGFHKSYLDLIIRNFGMTAVPRYFNSQGKIIWYLTPYTKLIWNGLYGQDAINIKEEDIYTGPHQKVDTFGFEYATGISLKSLFDKDRYLLLTLSRIGNHWLYDVNEFHNNAKTKDLFDKNDFETEWTLKGDYFFRINNYCDFTVGFNFKKIEDRFNTVANADTVWSYRYFHLYEEDTLYTYYHHQDYPWLIPPDGYEKDSIKLVYGKSEISEDYFSNKYSVYGQYKWKPFSGLNFTGGLRWTYLAFNKTAFLEPRLGISYKISPVITLNFGYGKHFQEPPAYQYVQNPANKKLKPKKTVQYILGIEHLFTEDTKGSLEIYKKYYANLPVYRSWIERDSLADYHNEMLSKGEGYIQGVEFFLQKKMMKNFHYSLSYSFTDSRFKDPRKENSFYRGNYDFRHVLTFISGYRWKLNKEAWYLNLKNRKWYHFVAWVLPLGDEVEFNLRWRFSKGRPYTAYKYDPYYRSWFTPWSQKLNTERYPDYHRMDILLVRRFIFRSMNLVTYLDIMNVYVRKNIWAYQYREDGSTEKIYQFSLFPVGGFTLEL